MLLHNRCQTGPFRWADSHGWRPSCGHGDGLVVHLHRPPVLCLDQLLKRFLCFYSFSSHIPHDTRNQKRRLRLGRQKSLVFLLYVDRNLRLVQALPLQGSQGQAKTGSFHWVIVSMWVRTTVPDSDHQFFADRAELDLHSNLQSAYLAYGSDGVHDNQA